MKSVNNVISAVKAKRLRVHNDYQCRQNCNVLIKLCSSIFVFLSVCGPLNVQWFASGIECPLVSFWIIERMKGRSTKLSIDPFAWHVLAKVMRSYHRISITTMAKIQFWLQFHPIT